MQSWARPCLWVAVISSIRSSSTFVICNIVFKPGPWKLVSHRDWHTVSSTSVTLNETKCSAFKREPVIILNSPYHVGGQTGAQNSWGCKGPLWISHSPTSMLMQGQLEDCVLSGSEYLQGHSKTSMSNPCQCLVRGNNSFSYVKMKFRGFKFVPATSGPASGHHQETSLHSFSSQAEQFHLYSHERSSSPLNTILTFSWIRSGMFLPPRCWGALTWTQYFKCASPGLRRKEGSPPSTCW